MSYTLEPWVEKALSTLPWIDRIKTRAVLGYHLRRASGWDDVACGIMNRMDCGVDLANYITGGRLSRAEKERDRILDEKVHPIMTRLKYIHLQMFDGERNQNE